MSTPTPPPPPPGSGDYQPVHRGHKETVAGRPLVVPGRKIVVAGQQVELASPWKRLGARLIDFVIILAPTLAISYAVFDFGRDDRGLGVFFVSAVIFAAIDFLYEATLVAKRGQTVGKMATGIRIIRADSGGLPGWNRSIRRWAIPGLTRFIPNDLAASAALVLCYLSLTWGRNHQGWHDMVAGTLVVRIPASPPPSEAPSSDQTPSS